MWGVVWVDWVGELIFDIVVVSDGLIDVKFIYDMFVRCFVSLKNCFWNKNVIMCSFGIVLLSGEFRKFLSFFFVIFYFEEGCESLLVCI